MSFNDPNNEIDFFGTAMMNGFPMAAVDLAKAEERARRQREEAEDEDDED